MKIVSWNCAGGFRNKFQFLKQLDADIYIIQECENPKIIQSIEYKEFAHNYIWIGHKHKGLGIFAKASINLENNNWPAYGLEYFISCKVNNKIDLIGVWGCNNYIEDIYTYCQIYKDKLAHTVIGGDFNSNIIWDTKNKRRNHSSLINELMEVGLISVYHEINMENQGEENTNTFYMYRHEHRPYHIDYFFCEPTIVRKLEIGDYIEWKLHSDHMPIILEIDLPI